MLCVREDIEIQIVWRCVDVDEFWFDIHGRFGDQTEECVAMARVADEYRFVGAKLEQRFQMLIMFADDMLRS